MKVKDLLQVLSGVDPDANVLIAAQPTYPIEYALVGVAVRSDFCGEDDDPASGSPTDVLLVEGSFARYGSRDVWSSARTA